MFVLITAYALFFIILIKDYTSFLDILTRVNINDSALSILYFFWTNFTYLPIFYFTILNLVFLFSLSYRLSISYILLNLLLSLLIFTKVDYLTLNLSYYTILILNDDINLLLTNTINKYHPFILYTSTFYFFINYHNITSIKVMCNWNFFYLPKPIYSYLYYIVFALYLGSWWALQEGSWGGWWNWDPSEVLGLIIFLFLIFNLHRNTNYTLTYITSGLHKNQLLWLLYIYVLVQLNFTLISHNFGIRPNSYISYIYIYNHIFYVKIFYNLSLL